MEAHSERRPDQIMPCVESAHLRSEMGKMDLDIARPTGIRLCPVDTIAVAAPSIASEGISTSYRPFPALPFPDFGFDRQPGQSCLFRPIP